MIENTTQTVNGHPDAVLLLAMLDGPSQFVENMEARGQQQLLNSDVLPTDLGFDTTQEDYEALGFTFGDVVEDDPLFMHATLPEGWSRNGTDHSMHSDIVDERGIARIGIFYKAAYYDRCASMHIINVGRDIASKHVYEGDDLDAHSVWPILTEEERQQCIAGLEDYVAMHAQHPDIWVQQGPAAAAFLATLTTAVDADKV